MLYLTGYGLELDDLKDFRQWGSATPGHPEVHHTAGVEVTTGPLGQGFANGVGMAIAEQSLRSRFGADVVDHHIYGIVSDGDLSEGVSHEAASLAGHLGLGRLVYVYDDNHISIDGPTELALSDDAVRRFESYGWQVIELGEAGEDLDALEAALVAARRQRGPAVADRAAHPHRVPVAGPHRRRRGPRPRVRRSRDHAPPRPSWASPTSRSTCPQRSSSSTARPGRVARSPVRTGTSEPHAALAGREAEWEATLGAIGLPGWEAALPTFGTDEKPATRVASQQVLNAIYPVVPGLVAGGADLTGNVGLTLKGETLLSSDEPGGPQIAFGIREHAMGSALVGAALHGGVLPVGGTFLVFSRLHAPGGPPRRDLPGEGRVRRGPTTRWASARTARPTSRSSTSCRSVSSPT